VHQWLSQLVHTHSLTLSFNGSSRRRERTKEGLMEVKMRAKRHNFIQVNGKRKRGQRVCERQTLMDKSGDGKIELRDKPDPRH